MLEYEVGVAAVHEHDCTVLSLLYGEDYVVGASTGIIVGDVVRILDGPLMGKESIIHKVEWHKRMVFEDVAFAGKMHMLKLPLEVVGKM